MLLEADSLSKSYGHHVALRRVDISIRPGFLGVVGPNGSGKTTLLRMLAGILAPTHGHLRLDGRDIQQQLIQYRDRVGYKPQNTDLYMHETAAGGLEYFARLKNIPPRLIKQRIDWALATFELTLVQDQQLTTLSTGEKQRFLLAQALLSDPDILVLDEPTVGLDGLGRLELFQLLNRLATRRAVIVSTHILSEIEPCGGRVLVLREGSVVALGPPSILAARAEGQVWEVALPVGATDRITQLQQRYKVTAVRQVEAESGEATSAVASGPMVHLRLLAGRPPHPDARPVAPTLEEGYLVCMGS